MNGLKFAFRQLLKNPGFTAVAVLTLALGIGANTAIFSLADAFLLRMLPVTEPQRLFFLSPAGGRGVAKTFNYVTFEHLRNQPPSPSVHHVHSYIVAERRSEPRRADDES
jgi:hypothetical protein